MFTALPGLLTPLLFTLADSPTPQVIAHAKPVYAVLYSPDGETLLSAGDDGYVRVWDIAARRQTRHWKAHEGGALVMARTADGKTLATGGRDGAVRLWDASTGKETWKYEGIQGDVESLSLSDDGRTLAVSSSGSTQTFRTQHRPQAFT
jgi:WD40 repeat protein